MRLLSLMTAAIFGNVPWTEARAEPQVLALLATSEATPLTCAGGECFAEFTAFCTEPKRNSPYHLTDYQLIEGADDVQVVAKSADGAPVTALVSRHLRFTSARGFAAVRVSIDESVVRRLGAAHVSLSVGRSVALAPVPSPKHHRPHDAGEIALAAGPRRARGEMIVDRGGVPREVAALTNRLINALPENVKVTEARRQSLWHTTVSAQNAGRYDPRPLPPPRTDSSSASIASRKMGNTPSVDASGAFMTNTSGP
jgi:hypothetical protein